MSHSFLTAAIIHVEVVPSTSDLARGLLLHESPPPLPFVVSADEQLAARGRGSNRWYTDRGSLGLTFAFDPTAAGLSPRHEPALALAFGALFIRALEELGHIPPGRAGLRWPNDLETSTGKFGGLLPERVDTPQGTRLLLGFGLNVATRLDRAPAEVQRIGTSLVELIKNDRVTEPLEGFPRSDPRPTVPLDPHQYRELALVTLDEAITRLAGQDPALPRLWARMDLLLGQPVRVQLPHRLVAGTGQGIDDRGRLVVASEQGVETLTGGTVLRAR